MHEVFFQNFNEKVPLTTAEKSLVGSYLLTKKLKRKQYLLQEGEVCRYIAVVEQGALKAYHTQEDGAEHIMQFALEGWLVSDLSSFLTGDPATLNIDALEDTTLTLIDKSAYDELMLKIPKFETYIRLQLTGAYIALQRRISSIVSRSPEERYKHLLAAYPHIVQRVPQHMIAPYMGLTPETLSRVRGRIATRKGSLSLSLPLIRINVFSCLCSMANLYRCCRFVAVESRLCTL